MQNKVSTLVFSRPAWRYVAAISSTLLVVSFALAQGASQLRNPRRVTSLQIADAPEGSRVIVTADRALDDYEAFRRGDRFYVRIPATEFSALQPGLSGAGFDDVQIQKVGDSLVISFRLQPGTNAHVAEGANRLEVIFFAPNRIISNTSANAVRNRVTRPGSGARPRSNREMDIAGPMPPNSSSSYSSSSGSESTESGVMNGLERSNRLPANRRNSELSVTKASALPETSPVQTPSPAPSSQYLAQYPPASAGISPTAPQTYSHRPIDSPSAGIWSKRRTAVQRWVSENRIITLAGGIALLSLICGVVFFSYRRRRRGTSARVNMPRVQPKYSPGDDLEEIFNAEVSPAPKVTPGPYVDSEVYENWGNDDFVVGATESLLQQPLPEYQDNIRSQFIGTHQFTGMTDEQWEIPDVSNQAVYKGKAQEEREVFEL